MCVSMCTRVFKYIYNCFSTKSPPPTQNDQNLGKIAFVRFFRFGFQKKGRNLQHLQFIYNLP